MELYNEKEIIPWKLLYDSFILFLNISRDFSKLWGIK